LPFDRVLNVVAAGKAARPMARALVDRCRSESRGRSRPGVTLGDVLVANGTHPVPDRGSLESGLAALKLATATHDRGECLLVLLSGGASAMLAAPAAGLSLPDKIDATRVLLQSGLPIADVNAVRKHMSAIKGGQLAAAAGQSISFVISDVHAPVEDDPAVIGSGPTVGDDSTFASALGALERAGILDAMPAAVVERLGAGLRGDYPETVRPDDPRLRRSAYVVAGSRRDAMAAVAWRAKELGYHVVTVDPPTLGEAREAATRFFEAAAAMSRHAPRPLCIVASGETTVRVTGSGRGGRNQEFALAAARELPTLGTSALASVGTDGIDGPTDAAGAVADSTTGHRARDRGLNGEIALTDNNAYPFFQALGDLVVTGPTETNVGDLQILLVE
jgi:glycerate 2-kinase